MRVVVTEVSPQSSALSGIGPRANTSVTVFNENVDFKFFFCTEIWLFLKSKWVSSSLIYLTWEFQ